MTDGGLSGILIGTESMKLLQKGARTLGLTLTAEHLEAFQLYYEELIVWKERLNLTAITAYEDVQIKHFLDSLSCLLALADSTEPARARDLGGLPPLYSIDIGTGAGFPGLPLKIVWPRLRLTLLEATGKKVVFLEHMVDRLGLEGVAVIKGRAEEMGRDPGHRERYDLVLARAVAPLPILVEYALPLCRLGGRVVAQKGADVQAEAEAAEEAMAIVGGRLVHILTVDLPSLAEGRSLVVIEKMAPTPDKYPRRPGRPGKRPLGARS